MGNFVISKDRKSDANLWLGNLKMEEKWGITCARTPYTNIFYLKKATAEWEVRNSPKINKYIFINLT